MDDKGEMVKFPVGKAGWNAPNKKDHPGDGSWSRFEVWSHDLEAIILETIQNYCESTFLTKTYNVGSQFQVKKSTVLTSMWISSQVEPRH